MPEIQTQTYANHTRFHPPFHFVLVPLLLGFLILAFVQSFRNPGLLTESLVVLGCAVLLLALLARTYALQVQDRLIRLEEQHRMSRLLSPALLQSSSGLNVKQFVALRFASDAELPALVEQALKDNLSGGLIKKRIAVWRPDYDRV